LDQAPSLGKATRKRVGVAEMPGRDVEEAPRPRIPALHDRALQRGDGPGNVAAAEGHEPQAPVAEDEAVVMLNLASDLDRLLAARQRFGEIAELREPPDESV